MLRDAMIMIKKGFYTCLICLMLFQANPSYAAEIENIKFELGEEEAVLTFFHIKGGEAALLQDGLGHNILLNTGSDSSEKELLSMLELFQIKKLDEIIITGQEKEYDGNLLMLLKKFSPAALHVPKHYSPPGDLPVGLRVDHWGKESGIVLENGVQIKAIHHKSEPFPAMDLSIKFGKTRLGYMTIYSLDDEPVLMKQYLKDINIMKVPAFVENEFLSEDLVEHMDPQTAILQDNEQYKEISDFIELLYEMWIDVYIMEQAGTVSVKMNRHHYEIITFPDAR